MTPFPGQVGNSTPLVQTGSPTLLDKVLKPGHWAAVAGLVIGLLGALFVYHSHWWSGSATSPIRVAGRSGCPGSLADHDGVSNSGVGFWIEMVPRNPTGAIVCEYPPAAPPPMSKAVLAQPAAGRLAAAADSASTFRPANTGCAWAGGSVVVVAFSYQGRSDVDLWYDPGDCGLLSNGRLQSRTTTKFGQLVQAALGEHDPAATP